jgi:hypothetical protein
MKIYLLFTALIFSGNIFAQADNSSYPVAVAFRSKCCGVPDNKPVIDFVKSFKKKYHLKQISYDQIGPLGKEGEYEMCFRLKEMTKKQAVLFISGLKKITPKMIDRGMAEVEEHKSDDHASLPGRIQVVKIGI